MNEEKLEKLKKVVLRGYSGLLFITIIINLLIMGGVMLTGIIRWVLYLLKRL
jgi:hypothetical protein